MVGGKYGLLLDHHPPLLACLPALCVTLEMRAVRGVRSGCGPRCPAWPCQAGWGCHTRQARQEPTSSHSTPPASFTSDNDCTRLPLRPDLTLDSILSFFIELSSPAHSSSLLVHTRAKDHVHPWTIIRCARKALPDEAGIAGRSSRGQEFRCPTIRQQRIRRKQGAYHRCCFPHSK